MDTTRTASTEATLIDMIRNFASFYPTNHIGNLIQGIPSADARAVFVAAFGEGSEEVAEVDRHHGCDEPVEGGAP